MSYVSGYSKFVSIESGFAIRDIFNDVYELLMR